MDTNKAQADQVFSLRFRKHAVQILWANKLAPAQQTQGVYISLAENHSCSASLVSVNFIGNAIITANRVSLHGNVPEGNIDSPIRSGGRIVYPLHITRNQPCGTENKCRRRDKFQDPHKRKPPKIVFLPTPKTPLRRFRRKNFFGVFPDPLWGANLMAPHSSQLFEKIWLPALSKKPLISMLSERGHPSAQVEPLHLPKIAPNLTGI